MFSSGDETDQMDHNHIKQIATFFYEILLADCLLL